MAPVILVLTTGKWILDGDVKKRQFFKRSIAERVWEMEVAQKVWISEWSPPCNSHQHINKHGHVNKHGWRSFFKIVSVFR